MELTIKEKDKNNILLEIKGIDLGMAYAIIRELLNDERVLNAWAKKDHPLKDTVKMYVLTNNEIDPFKALNNALDTLQSELNELKEIFMTEFKIKIGKR